MSWQDDARANGYVQVALNANNDRELEQGMRAADNAVEILDGAANAVGNVVRGIFSSPEPPPPPKSSGGGLGGLLVLGALAGGAYLLSKAFGSSDDDRNNKFENKESQQVSQPQIYQPTDKTCQDISTPVKNDKQRQKSRPSHQFKSELSNIKGLISNPKSNTTKINELLHKLEDEVTLYRDGSAMKRVAEYYQKINCDYDAQRCYEKAEIFEEAYRNEIENAKQVARQADSYFANGNDYLKQQNYEQAIQFYDNAIQLNPNYSLAYKNRGKCYQALGDSKKAQSDFSKAKELRKKV